MIFVVENFEWSTEDARMKKLRKKDEAEKRG